MNGSLAMIKSLRIQDELEKQVVIQYGPNGSAEFWVGGLQKGGTWFWIDGTTIPMSGPNQKWRNSRNTYMILSAYRSTRDNMRWFSKNDGARGFMCEVSEVDICETLNCMNDGVCIAVGCQANCHCINGYGGANCQTDLIILTPIKSKITVTQQQNVSVALLVATEDGLVRIDVFQGISSVVLNTKRNVTDRIVEFILGPLTELDEFEVYRFRATPEFKIGLYYKVTYVTIVVQGTQQPLINSGMLGGIVAGAFAAVCLAILIQVLLQRRRNRENSGLNADKEDHEEGPYAVAYFKNQRVDFTYDDLNGPKQLRSQHQEEENPYEGMN